MKAVEACACGGRKAVGVDAAGKVRNQARLARIEGQIRGVAKMIEEDRYCADILGQVAAVQQALRAVGRELLRNHLKHCASSAIRKGGAGADAMCDELLDLFYQNAK